MNTQNYLSQHEQARRLVELAHRMKQEACQVLILAIEAKLNQQQRKQQGKS